MLENNRWFIPGHVTVKKCLCGQDIELLTVILHPFLCWRSSYVPFLLLLTSSHQRLLACDIINSITTRSQTGDSNDFMVNWEDFHHPSLSATQPGFYKFVSFPARENKTLYLLYANVKHAYRSAAKMLTRESCKTSSGKTMWGICDWKSGKQHRSTFIFTIYTSDFQYNLQNMSEDSAILGCQQ